MVFGLFKKKTESRETAALKFIHGTLSVSMALGDVTGKAVSGDYWAMGYVFGFHDGVLQAMKVVDQVEGMALMAASYDTLFPDVGGSLFDQSLELQHEPEFHQGMVAGGTEVTEFMRTQRPPMGLAKYFQEKFKGRE